MHCLSCNKGELQPAIKKFVRFKIIDAGEPANLIDDHTLSKNLSFHNYM